MTREELEAQVKKIIATKVKTMESRLKRILDSNVVEYDHLSPMDYGFAKATVALLFDETLKELTPLSGTMKKRLHNRVKGALFNLCK